MQRSTETRHAPGVEPREDFLRVYFGGTAGHADFHYFWLRHNCDCCRHPVTRERIICSSDVPLDIEPLSVTCDGESSVRIVWPQDGGSHDSEYSLEWLAKHAYAADRQDVAPPPHDVRLLEIDRKSLPASARLPEICLERIAERGAVVIRNAGPDTEALIDEFANSCLRVVETHFGRIEDLRTDNTTNKNTDQLGYTDAPVDLHTDQPFIEEPPHYQMLHCMREADSGGESYLADARQATEYLAATERHTFELLTTVPVSFHRVQKQFESLKLAPVIELRDGKFFRVRSSYFTMAPHRVPFGEMGAWYRAYNRFARLVGSRRHQYRFALHAGDFLMYDNFRMLHARTAFTGARWVRGVYFN
jgi:gamma-butyrobetaine dioxygenase/trimethyllysine dioxygenase